MSGSILPRCGLLALLLVGGCLTGAPPPAGDDTSSPPDAVSIPDAIPSNCEIARTPSVQKHNQGRACMDPGCHGQPTQVGAPEFAIAGTLWAAAQGTAAVEGATITVVDINNVTVKLTTGAIGPGGGNFYYLANQPPLLTPPFTVMASKCPTTMSMGVLADTGNCNSCHSIGGAAGAQVHL